MTSLTSYAIVNLNIGGTIFSTTTSTLLNDDASATNKSHDGHNYFHGLLNENTTNLLDQNGHYFIDRDPTFFRYILNQLRDGSVSLPNELKVLQEILREATFFAVQPLVSQIEATISQLEKDHNSSKSNETQYTIVTTGSSKFEQIFRQHTESGTELEQVIQCGTDHQNGDQKLLVVFKKPLSNGQADLLTSLMEKM